MIQQLSVLIFLKNFWSSETNASKRLVNSTCSVKYVADWNILPHSIVSPVMKELSFIFYAMIRMNISSYISTNTVIFTEWKDAYQMLRIMLNLRKCSSMWRVCSESKPNALDWEQNLHTHILSQYIKKRFLINFKKN